MQVREGLSLEQIRAVGTASDASGAVLPDVSIRATNLATNVARDTTTDASGGYSIPSLPAGDYTVTATRKGFQTQKADRIQLEVRKLRVSISN